MRSLTRDSRFGEANGFVAYHLPRGPEREDHVFHSSHTMEATQEEFSAGTQSGQFRAAHQ